MTVHVAKKLLVVVVLVVPFLGFVVAEVVAERNQDDVRIVQGGFLSVLVKQCFRSFSMKITKRGRSN